MVILLDKMQKKDEERRRSNAEYRRQYRQKLSSQKKRRIREKDAARKREKRKQIRESKEKIKKNTENDLMSSKESMASSDESVQISKSAVQKAVYRARQKIPQSPKHYAKVVSGLVTNVTPRRKAELEKEGIHSPGVKKKLDLVFNVIKEAQVELQGRTKKQRLERKAFVCTLSDQIRKKYGILSLFCKATGIQRKFLAGGCKKEQKKRKDMTSTEIVKSVHNFFDSENVSTSVPNVKCVTEKRVLQTSLESAYNSWKDENPGKNLSYDKFCKLRPKHVLNQKHRKLFQCLFQYCENMKLKIQEINKLADKCKKPELKLKDKYSAVNESMCPKDGNRYHKLDCIDRKCNNCGVINLENKLVVLSENEAGNISWKKWSMVKRTNPKNNKEMSRRELISVNGLVTDLIEEFCKELEFFSIHLFEAEWQISQFAELKTKLPQNILMLTVDFAENYTCFSQNEVQGQCFRLSVRPRQSRVIFKNDA